ncbi:MAG: hypothetical protein D6731_04755 [Planctomycetota bacterium]|nr:MAG: hypothetical protein D6731_04755 [Planctomycetota bacterium]
MDCAACHGSMEEVEVDGVTIDRCTACGGVWLDDGEAEELAQAASEDENPLLAQKLRVLREWKVAEAEPAPVVDRRCPRCDEAMQRVHYKGTPGLLVERCPRHCGLYLDKGELEKVRLLG